MRMELDQMMKEFAQTPGAPRASNVTRRGLGCCNTAGRTEPTTPNGRHTRCPRFAWRAHSINVALRKALLEDLAELHLAGTALERAARVPLKSCATLRTMKLRHGCRLTPQLSGRTPPHVLWHCIHHGQLQLPCWAPWREVQASPSRTRQAQRTLRHRSNSHFPDTCRRTISPPQQHVSPRLSPGAGRIDTPKLTITSFSLSRTPPADT